MQASRNIPLITAADPREQQNNQSITDQAVEPVFRIADATDLSLDTQGWDQAAGDFMSYRVARIPGDLRNHVQRINHSIAAGDPENVYGAVLDLFIVLKDKGQPLRSRILHTAQPLLPKFCYTHLLRRLKKGISEQDTVPPSDVSVLSRGHLGLHEVVTKSGTSRTRNISPLEEARSHMEYGQLDAARSVLESAVLTGSLEEAVHEDLIEIYIRTDDKPGFLKTQRQLNFEGSSSSVLALWREFEAFFKKGKQ